MSDTTTHDQLAGLRARREALGKTPSGKTARVPDQISAEAARNLLGGLIAGRTPDELHDQDVEDAQATTRSDTAGRDVPNATPDATLPTTAQRIEEMIARVSQIQTAPAVAPGPTRPKGTIDIPAGAVESRRRRSTVTRTRRLQPRISGVPRHSRALSATTLIAAAAIGALVLASGGSQQRARAARAPRTPSAVAIDASRNPTATIAATASELQTAVEDMTARVREPRAERAARRHRRVGTPPSRTTQRSAAIYVTPSSRTATESATHAYSPPSEARASSATSAPAATHPSAPKATGGNGTNIGAYLGGLGSCVKGCS